jgi:plasmid stabilization system protein ParE
VTQYILSEDADRDLDGIWDYIAEDSIDAADQWISRLFEAFDAIGNTPGIGHRRDDLTAYTVLFWPVGAYLIIWEQSHKFTQSSACSKIPKYPGCGNPVCDQPDHPGDQCRHNSDSGCSCVAPGGGPCSETANPPREGKVKQD